MIHTKRYYCNTYEAGGRELIIEGPVEPERLASMTFDEGLKAFRVPEEQQKALVEIAELPEGRIIIARDGDLVLGYVTYLHPDPMERWSEAKMEDLLELGAIEVSHKVRAAGVGKAMLELSYLDDALEDYIVISTEYYWHWDLKGTGLDVWGYRKIMEKVMGSIGMIWMATDDPEICSHPANCLMARIGKRVQNDRIMRFDQVRFQNRFMY
ncbi:UNVERIFIED_CONTAM: acetoin utilization protein AcuA [Brevibacillus sp. OAP136]